MLPQAVLYLCDSSKYNRLDFSAISATSCSISTGNLPLLQTEWVAQKELLEFKDKFTAFIFTSARAVDGFFESTNNNNSAGIHPIPASSRWFYVVGEATGARLRERLTSISPSSGYIIYGDRQGITLNVKRDGQVDPYHQLDNEKCLNAHQLASLIIRHDNNIRNIMSNSSSSNYPVPVIPSYIFFTGDKTRDVLPDVLIRAGISSQLRQIQVYRTTSRPAEDILADLKQHLQSFSSSTSSSTRLVLLVLFSPSGADIMVPIIIKEQLQLIINGFEFIWAAIGSTTASHLQSEHGITPTFTSKYPSPQGFWESFQEHFL